MLNFFLSFFLLVMNPKYDSIQSIPTPENYQRVAVQSSSFGEYLRNLPLKSDNTVYLYNGKLKPNQTAQFAVIKMDVGKKDLQQCADAVMRLRAEYLFKNQQFSKIHFNFTNGFRCEYQKYSQGYRPVFKGKNTVWELKAKPDNSYAGFRSYMDLVFNYAGTSSLEKELKSVKINDMQIGDVFIKGGFPGHAEIVVDMAVFGKKKVFMLAQSYMPAQDIHVLKNPNRNSLSPWYELNFGTTLITPEWTFESTQLKRFQSE